MREIKFRAWDKGNEYMFYASERNGCSEYYFDFVGDAFKLLMPRDEDYPYEVDAIIMQYTGLKDKNGKEIYEGDVVNLEINGYNMKCVYVPFLIVFNIDGFQGCNLIKNKKDFLNGSFLKQPRRFNYKEWKKFQVIGNIYENPELLKND